MISEFKELTKTMGELTPVTEIVPNMDLYEPAGRAYATAADILRGTGRRYTLIEEHDIVPFTQLLKALKKVPAKMDISNIEITKGVAG